MKVNCIIWRTKLRENEKLMYDEPVRGRGAYGKHGGEEIAYVYRALVWKPEEKKTTWGPRRKWETHWKEIVLQGMGWIHLAQLTLSTSAALENQVINLPVPYM